MENPIKVYDAEGRVLKMVELDAPLSLPIRIVRSRRRSVIGRLQQFNS